MLGHQAADIVASDEQVIAATKIWLERAVIGQQLCPFAASQYLACRVRFHVSSQRSTARLLKEMAHELQLLRDSDPLQCETTLLIYPRVLTEFLDYDDFLDDCDAAIAELGMKGELQVASFHPNYQFAGTAEQDITTRGSKFSAHRRDRPQKHANAASAGSRRMAATVARLTTPALIANRHRIATPHLI